MLEYWLKRYTGRSNSWIGKDLGVSKDKVGRKRDEMEGQQLITPMPVLRTEDGRSYPRHPKPRTPKPGLPDTSPLLPPAAEAEAEAPLTAFELERWKRDIFRSFRHILAGNELTDIYVNR